MNITKVLESSNVERFHSATGVAKQTIAQHSWGVAMLCQYFKPDCSKELILAALTHDCSELETGDIPSTAKWKNPKLKLMLDKIEAKTEEHWGIAYKLSTDENKLLKLCDALEGMNYCIQRRKQGELEASDIFYRWVDFVSDKFIFTNDKEHDFYYSLILEMGDINHGRK